MNKNLLFTVVSLLMVVTSFSQDVTTFAGSGATGSTDATGTAASFYVPSDVAVDVAGNLYIADAFNNKIRKITAAGVVTTLAGSGTQGSTDGTGATASFKSPRGVAVDASGNVYVADQENDKIRKITASGVVTTFAGSSTFGSTDGIGTAASFNYPYGLAVDGSGNVYVADTYNNKIRKITAAGVVTTFAGSGDFGSADGVGTAASFYGPHAVVVDVSGNVYVADTNNNRIRKITAAGVVTTLAGSGDLGSADGIGTAASFFNPRGLTVDGSGNVYVGDSFSHKIRKITATGVVTTFAGSGSSGSLDGTGTAASLALPYGVDLDGSGNLYVADSGNSKIRKITPPPATHLNFDGVNDRINCGNSPSVQITGSNITLEAMIRLNSFASFPNDGNIINKEQNSPDNGYMLRVGGSGIVNFNIGNGSWNEINSPVNAVQLATWHHVVGTYDGVTMKIYVDGVMVTSQPSTMSIGNSTSDLFIGDWPNGGRNLDGDIDEVRIWNKVLTATDIMNHMNCELQSAETGLVAYYKFNQGNDSADNTTITTVTDASGNANNGTLSNFARTGTTSNFLLGSPIVTGTTCTTLNATNFEVANNIKMYPNPTNGIFTIETQEVSTVELYDMIGKKVLSKKVSIGSSNLDLSNYTNGIYLLMVTNQNGNLNTYKLIKQ